MNNELDKLLETLEAIENRLLAKDELTPEEDEMLKTVQSRKKQGEILRDKS